MITSAWDRRNADQVGPLRRNAHSIPFGGARILLATAADFEAVACNVDGLALNSGLMVERYRSHGPVADP